MRNIKWQDYIMSGPQQRKQRQHHVTIATTNGSRAGAATATGTQAMLQRDTARLSNSEMDMTLTCNRGRMQTEYNRATDITAKM